MVSIASFAIFTHLFTAHSYGTHALATAAISVAAPVLSQWVAQPVDRYWAEYSKRHKAPRFGAVSSAVGLVVYMWLIALGGAVAVAQGIAGRVWHPLSISDLRCGANP
jgi:O-antigen/teichoic acid export membrane protein